MVVVVVPVCTGRTVVSSVVVEVVFGLLQAVTEARQTSEKQASFRNFIKILSVHFLNQKMNRKQALLLPQTSASVSSFMFHTLPGYSVVVVVVDVFFSITGSTGVTTAAFLTTTLVATILSPTLV